MGRHINRGNDGFRRYTKNEYVDKTGLIAYINSTIGADSMLTCVSRPRRFGKSMAAQMLYAYYDHSCDSRELFAPYKIADDPSFSVYLNKYPAIYIDITDFTTRFAGREDIVDLMQERILKDLTKAYPDIPVEEGSDLMDYLLDIAVDTGEKFVMIIDEWDALCRESADKPQLMDSYVNLLRRLFKGSDTARVFACVYMTGILPIKRYGTQSALNDFREFSMSSPRQLADYFGFTEQEVRQLCAKYALNYADMKGWYDGYSFGAAYPSVFNPNSVMAACRSGSYENYWGRTSAFETLQQYIDLNMSGVQESLYGILRGETVRVLALRFGFNINSIDSDDELLTLFIHLGYLAYNVEDMTVRIPNKEIRMEFVEALRGSKTHKRLSALVKTSDQLMAATVRGDENTVAEIIGQLHDSTTAPDFYNNEQALRSVLKIGYLSAIDDYVSIQELPTGKGYADLAFIPRRGSSKAAIVVELKWDRPVMAAIDQIKERDYPAVLRDFADNILLVGISYDTETKQHTCQIERWPKEYETAANI